MNHHRPMMLAVRPNVGELELVRQMKIHLNGRVGLFVAHHVGKLDVELRSVKRSLPIASTYFSPSASIASRSTRSPSAHIPSLSTYFSLFAGSRRESR